MGTMFDRKGFRAFREKGVGLVKHHLLAVSIYPEYREEGMNHIWMSPYNHTMNGAVCPHGSLPVARQAFNRWMKKNMPERYEWMVKHSRREIDLGVVGEEVV